MPLKARLFLILIVCAHAVDGLALSNDRDQATHIRADYAEFDHQSGLASYRGNVEVRQGILQLTGDTLLIQRVDGEIQTLTITGNPARYQQLPDQQTHPINAQAKQIAIYPPKDLVVMQNDARIEQQGRIVTGNRLEYHRQDDIVKGMSNTLNQPAGSPIKQNRIHITILPTPDSD